MEVYEAMQVECGPVIRVGVSAVATAAVVERWLRTRVAAGSTSTTTMVGMDIGQ